MDADPRPLRADAERNRRRILDAARDVFAEHGFGVGIDTVARTACVGVGTVYRRFPTKEDLLQAVIADRVDALCARLSELGEPDPWAAFVAAAEALAAAFARDRALFQVLQDAQVVLPDRDAARDRTTAAIAPFLQRAQRAGAVRDDLVPLDVLSLCAIASRLPHWRLEREPEIWRRYLAIVLDGVRPGAAHPLPHAPPADVRFGSAGQQGLDRRSGA